MILSLCNEVLRDRDFAGQCDYAARLGYGGLEVAPFTLCDDPRDLTTARVATLRRQAADAGVAVTGLHWLLLTPPGLSITDPRPDVVDATRDVIRRLVDLCAELGGSVLVHGSPQQRAMPDRDAEHALAAAEEHLAAAGAAARAVGVTYCIEPLDRKQTDFINTVAEAAALVERIGEPGLRTMVDTASAGVSEAEPVAAVLDRWLPSGLIAHVQVNSISRRGPGQGPDRFAEVFAVLARHGYDRVVAVEPFDYEPDGPAAAARAAGYVQGLLEAQNGRETRT